MAALLADAREELGMLAEAASCAEATYHPSAPLAEALRAEVARELAELEAGQAALARDAAADDAYRRLSRRVVELRVAASEALSMLQGALTDSAALSTETSPGTTVLVGSPEQLAFVALTSPDSAALPQRASSRSSAATSSSLTLSPAQAQMAAAIGDLAADMREALDDIHSVRMGLTTT